MSAPAALRDQTIILSDRHQPMVILCLVQGPGGGDPSFTGS